MPFQMRSLEMKAVQNKQEVDLIRGKKPKTMKDLALRSEQDYRKYLEKKKGRKQTLTTGSETAIDKPYFERTSPVKPLIMPDKEKPPNERDAGKSLSDDQQGLPPLHRCAELLLERVHFIKYGECLYCYNDICYDIVDKDDVISLYRDKVDAKLGNVKSLGSISQLHRFLCTDKLITIKESEHNKRIAVLKNGIYDVMREELLPHSHEDIVFSYVDADYVEDGECPYFEKFLQDVTDGDEVLQERIWMFLGYTFLQTTEAKTFFVMGEAPDSGKSLLGNFIESLYPEQYVSNIALTDLNRNFALAPIVGKAVNISLDLPSSRLNTMAVSKLKMLTGGDAININEKNVPEYRYRNRAKLIFASNFPIRLIEPDDAFWNRLVYLPFNKSVPKAKQDIRLSEKFQRERNVIVSKALHYARQLVLNDFCFSTTPQIERKMQEWQGRTCATIENFISDCCICGEEIRGELVDTLYRAYESYCGDTGYVAKNRYIFKQFLEEQIGLKHFKMRDGGENPQSAFRGIQLLNGTRKRG